MRIVFSMLVIFIFLSCTQNGQREGTGLMPVSTYFNYGDSSVQTGGVKLIPITTPVGEFNVWTKRFGNNKTIKVLLLHGGPAMTHEYMECFESFFPKQGFEFYEYDQLGSYYSDQPADSSLWQTARFVEEVEQVRKAIGADKDNFYVLGNSWGGILAMEYALKYQQHLKGLIVCNMMASIPRYEAYGKRLRETMRKTAVDSLMAYEALKQFDDANYQQLLRTEYYNKHICRLPVWPDAVNRTFKHVNYPIYLMMQGPSEFSVAGRLLNWDRWNDLKNIKVPTLLVGAKYDTMDPEDMKKQSEMVQNGRYLFCPNGSHLSMWDDQKVFMDGVIQFVKDVDAGSF
jgi:proline iminopeptidase